MLAGTLNSLDSNVHVSCPGMLMTDLLAGNLGESSAFFQEVTAVRLKFLVTPVILRYRFYFERDK